MVPRPTTLKIIEYSVADGGDRVVLRYCSKDERHNQLKVVRRHKHVKSLVISKDLLDLLHRVVDTSPTIFSYLLRIFEQNFRGGKYDPTVSETSEKEN